MEAQRNRSSDQTLPSDRSKMAGCLDQIHWNRPDWLDFGEKRNAVASITAGVLVSLPGQVTQEDEELADESIV